VVGIILAAGQARRMGRAKLALPWGRETVIARVVQLAQAAACEPVVVVTGGWAQAVRDALAAYAVHFAWNPEYADGSMTRSLQIGLRHAPPWAEAALIFLGDQPHLPPSLGQAVRAAWPRAAEAIWQPSYHGRRGHPWLLPRRWWPALLAWPPERTLRAFIQHYAIPRYTVPSPNDAILHDMDTPEDYQRLLARYGPGSDNGGNM